MNRHLLAAILAAAAGMSWLASQPAAAPDAAPDSPLRLEWAGPTAAADRATMGNLCAGLADAIEQDGKRPEPRIRSGLQVEELRTIARDGRTRGVSIGERQPAARQAIGDYLDREAGRSGGPLDADSRARWVRAFRGVSTACGVTP